MQVHESPLGRRREKSKRREEKGKKRKRTQGEGKGTISKIALRSRGGMKNVLLVLNVASVPSNAHRHCNAFILPKPHL